MSSEHLHTRLLGNLKTAIILIEPNLTVSYLNSAAEALLEVSGSRVLGNTLSELFTEIDDSHTGLLQSIQDISAFTKRETRLQLPSGHQITVDCAVTPVEDESSEALIMELQPLDRLLRISREEGLLSSQQTSQTLVRGLAHEIKNPLGGIRGAAQLLAKELPDEQLTDYTNIIIEEADRLGNLVDRMLGSHKLLQMQPLNIHEVLERVRSLIDAETGSMIHFRRDYDPSIPDIIGDREQLIQATLNIVRNAMQILQAHPPKDEPATIVLTTRALRQFTIGAHRHRLVCRVDITDNGPGIPEDIVETIFLPMVSGRADGTGLGLSISQSIINHHKGLIECRSEPGATVFSLYIPIDQKHVEHIS